MVEQVGKIRREADIIRTSGGPQEADDRSMHVDMVWSDVILVYDNRLEQHEQAGHGQTNDNKWRGGIWE